MWFGKRRVDEQKPKVCKNNANHMMLDCEGEQRFGQKLTNPALAGTAKTPVRELAVRDFILLATDRTELLTQCSDGSWAYLSRLADTNDKQSQPPAR
ncbi:MAG: hypothetical protein MUD08_16200 [Cytophagales bacterium]|jgi:hypothetical protein|nr:hypothetical protein [Cytophagales bacterium]